METMKEGYLQKSPTCRVRRWVQTMDLRDDPALIAEYRHITDCIFIQRGLEAKKELNVEESVNIMEEIWGDDRIMNINKNKS